MELATAGLTLRMLCHPFVLLYGTSAHDRKYSFGDAEVAEAVCVFLKRDCQWCSEIYVDVQNLMV